MPPQVSRIPQGRPAIKSSFIWVSVTCVITDFHGCETEGSSFYLVVSEKELDENVPKYFLSFWSLARKKGDFEGRLRGDFDESMYIRRVNYINKG